MKKEQYIVKGMTCSACSATVQNNVSKKQGVSSCRVNLLNEKMDVEFDEKVTNEKEIFDLVKSLGYKPYTSDTKFDKQTDNAKLLKRNFFLSLIFLIPLMFLSMGHMIGLKIPFLNMEVNTEYFALTQAILAIPIIVINKHFYIKGFKLLFKLAPNMDSLVSLGSSASFIYSIVITVLLFVKPDSLNLGSDHHLFYESSVMILVLVTLGKFLEAKSKKKTGKAIEELYKFIPDTVTVEENGEQKRVNINDLTLGQIVVVKQDEYIPIDGTIIEGHSYIDKSAITGESMPVEVNTGDFVTSATINKNGVIKIKVEKIKGETTIAKIIKMVQDAGSSKAPIEKFADKVSLYFVPIVCAISIITFIIWMIITHGNFDRSINFAICVLVISCPCALGLATPIAVMVATGKAAKFGILFKDAESLQLANKVNIVLFDKTGTLTEGKPSVIHFENFDRSGEASSLAIAYSLEANSNHPLANSINEFVKEKNIDKVNITNYTYYKGLGGTGYVDNKFYMIGNQKLLDKFNVEYQNELINELENRFLGKTILYLASNKLIAIFVVADKVKESSKETIANLHSRGIKTALITGDAKQTANAIASELNITEVNADVLPEDKLDIVKKYQENYVVAFVGDGINDSPALKQANIGIAIASGNDIAIDCANVVLTNQNLDSINTMISLSKKTVNNIKLNLFWAFFYNVIGIFVAAGVLSKAGIVLTPMIGAAAMSLSSLFVVTNALRLQRFKSKNDKNKETLNIMKKTIYINGMMCMHCVARVEGILKNLPNVTKVTVNLKKKNAIIELSDELSNEVIINAITEAGYEVKKID